MKYVQILNKLVGEMVAEKKLKVNEVTFAKASILCEKIEDLLAEFSENNHADPTISIGSGVDISIYVDDLIFRDGCSHTFFKMIRDADCLVFSKSKRVKDSLEVRFRIDNLWVTS